MSPTTTAAAPSARLVDLLGPERPAGRSTPYGSVWDVVSEHGLGAALIVKEGEEIDPGWFFPGVVDLLLCLRGRLRVEFADGAAPPLTMRAGQLLVIEPGTRCRAYRWPRSSPRPAVFLAVYPEAARPAREARAHVPQRQASAPHTAPDRGVPSATPDSPLVHRCTQR